MTKEKAIKGLTSLLEVRRKYGDMQTMKDEMQCLEMAIKALEQEPCEDAISRKAAIDALRDAENHAFNSFYQGLIKAHKIIADLPPVTQKALEQEDMLDKIRAEIKAKIEEEEFARSVFRHEEQDTTKAEQCTGSIMAYKNVIKLIDKYKSESEV